MQVNNNFFPLPVQNQIYNIITSKSIPWTYRPALDIQKNPELKNILEIDSNIILNYGFSHTFLDLQNNSNFENIPINLLDLFKLYIKNKFDVEVNKCLRMIAMLTLPNPNRNDNTYLLPHVDVQVPHKVLLYYVNDSDGDTFIFNEKIQHKSQAVFTISDRFKDSGNFIKKTLHTRITPKKGTAVLFDGLQYHSGNVPSVDPRFVINFIFQ